jgi:hypothetical protein
MEINWTIILFTVLLIDSMGAILVAWFGQKWWPQAMGRWAQYFPPAKGWSILYFMLVLMLGYALGLL